MICCGTFQLQQVPFIILLSSSPNSLQIKTCRYIVNFAQTFSSGYIGAFCSLRIWLGSLSIRQNDCITYRFWRGWQIQDAFTLHLLQPQPHFSLLQMKSTSIFCSLKMTTCGLCCSFLPPLHTIRMFPTPHRSLGSAALIYFRWDVTKVSTFPSKLMQEMSIKCIVCPSIFLKQNTYQWTVVACRTSNFHYGIISLYNICLTVLSISWFWVCFLSKHNY